MRTILAAALTLGLTLNAAALAVGRITIKKMGPLGEVLAEIAKQTGVSVAVAPQAAARPVTVDMSREAGGDAVELASQMAGVSARAVEGGLAYGVSGAPASAEPAAQPDVKLAPVAGEGPELKRPVKLSASGVTLAAICAKLSQAAKTTISADAKVADERLSVFFYGAPLKDALAAVAHARGLTVKKGANGYMLRKRSR